MRVFVSEFSLPTGNFQNIKAIKSLYDNIKQTHAEVFSNSLITEEPRRWEGGLEWQQLGRSSKDQQEENETVNVLGEDNAGAHGAGDTQQTSGDSV